MAVTSVVSFFLQFFVLNCLKAPLRAIKMKCLRQLMLIFFLVPLGSTIGITMAITMGFGHTYLLYNYVLLQYGV